MFKFCTLFSNKNSGINHLGVPVFYLFFLLFGLASQQMYAQAPCNPPLNLAFNATPAVLCGGNTGSLSVSGANSYTWQPGNLTGNTVTVSPAVSTSYTVTGTGALGCTSSAVYYYPVAALNNMTVVPNQVPCTDTLRVSIPGAIGFPASANKFYIRDQEPWGVSNNTTALNAVFGAGNYQTVTFTSANPAAIFTSSTQFVFLEGSDANGIALNTFFTTNQTLIENWVNNGGRLFLNAAPNNGGNMNWGFGGVVLNYNNAQSTVNAITPLHPIFVGPFTPLATSFTGNSYSHAHITGGNTTPIITGGGVNVLTQKNWGAGLVLFGGITAPNFHTPATEAQNVWQNIMHYTAFSAGALVFNYLWSNNASTPYTLPVTPGTYTVTVSGYGCSGTASLNVTTVKPIINAVATPNVICSGNSTVLSEPGNNTNVWQPGNLSGASVTVSPTANTIYTLTATNAGNCSATDTVNVTVNPPLQVTIVQQGTNCLDSLKTVVTGVGNAAPLPGARYYIRDNDPWGTNNNVTAMNAVFGAGNYQTQSFSTAVPASVFSTATQFVFLEGADGNAVALNTFFTANQTLIENWVNNGGRLFINSAPNVGGNMNWGFGGVTLNYNSAQGTVTAVTPLHPVFVGPYTPLATTLTGNSYSHAHITGGNTTPIITGGGVNVLTQKTWGGGLVLFGGITSPNFHQPQIEAQNLWQNIIHYTANSSNGAAPVQYLWNTNATTSYIIPPTAGTYSVTVTANGCSATASFSNTVSINLSTNTSSICVGQSATISASGANSYVWQPGGNTGASITVNPSLTTTYTVTATNANGCTNTATQTIVVNALPTVTANANPSTLCAGTSTQLSATGGTSYTWQPGNLTGSPLVSPLATTTYTVTATNANGCSNTATKTVVVNALPVVTVLATPATLCAGASAQLSATGGTSYTWQPGNLTGSPTVTPTISTTYTVTATNANGCTKTATQLVTVNALPVVSAAANPSSVCTGGSSLLSATGGTSYTWQPGNLTGSPTVTPLLTTTYTVTATNANGCTNTATQTVSVSNTLLIAVNATPNSICVGGASQLSATGGTSYTWQPGNLTGAPSVSPLVTTTYTVTATNANGCTNSATIAVVVNANPTVSANANPATLCAGASSQLSATGGTSYTWQPGNLSGSPLVSPSVTTTYTVTATNANGCTSTATQLVTVNALPVVSATANSATICVGATAQLSATGGTSYTWQPGNLTGSPIVSPSVTTIYTVTATNASGCSNTATAIINVNALPTVSANANPSSLCAGATSQLSATGGTSYSWQPGNLTGSPVVSPSVTTIYTVTATNANGCSNTATRTVVVNALPNVSTTANPTSICNGASSQLSATGGTSYTWQPGSLSGSPIVSPSVTTTYTVTATNANGCTSTATKLVTVNALPVVSAAANPSSVCTGGSTQLSATGGTSYTWQPGNLTGSPTVTPTLTTTYTVTATNANGCTNTATQTVSVSNSLLVTVSATPSSICVGGASQLSATGGTSYSWQPGNLSGSPLVSPTITTTYTVTATNVSGCTNTASVTIAVNAIPTVGISANPSSICSGASSQLSATGGTSYTWQPGNLSGAPLVSPSVTTIYTVTATNANGCTNTATQTVSVSTILLVTANANPSTICAGATTQLNATGGTSYTWQPGNLTGSPIVSPSVTTTYTVTATNANGCSNTATAIINVNALPTVSANANPSTLCAGATSQLSATGATSYTWQPGNLTGSPVVSPSITTTYTVTATNVNGCTATTTTNIVVNAVPTLITSANPSSICVGISSQLSATGGTSYSWQPGNLTGSPTVFPTVTTTYTVTATNANGCTSTATQTVSVSNTLLVGVVANPSAICLGASSQLNATGGTTYSWQPGNLSGSPLVSPNVTTTYTVTVTNANGCSNTTTTTVIVNALPTVTTSANPSSICAGASAQLSATGGINYSWQPGNLSGTPTVSPTLNTTYTVTATNANGCSNTATQTIQVNSLPVINTGANPSSICIGGSAQLNATGGTSYVWQPGNLTGSPVVLPTINTIYTVTVTNANGCTNTATQSIAVNSLPLISTSSNPSSICNGGNATLLAFGGVSYSWQPGNLTGTPTVSPAVNTVYTVTATDNNGCTNTSILQVAVVPNPTVTAQANPSEICNGGGTILQGGGAVSYLWMPVNIFGSPMLFPTSNTTYTVTGTSANGCTATSLVTVNVVPPPTLIQNPTNQVSFNGGTAQFSVQSSNPNVTYQWQRDYGLGFQNLTNFNQFSGVTTPTLTVSNLTQANNGNLFRCQLSLPGCFVTSTAASLKVDYALGVNQINTNSAVSIYPNPANTTLNIHTELEALGSQLQLRDVSGRICYSNVIENENTMIPVGSLARGIYLLHVISTKGNWVYRIVLSD